MRGIGIELSVKRIVKFDGNGSLKAFCDLAVGEMFLIRSVKVIEGLKGLFVSMPREQGRNGQWYEVVGMLNKEAKTEVTRVVMEAYNDKVKF